MFISKIKTPLWLIQVILTVALILSFAALAPKPAYAATQNYALPTNVQTIPLFISGQRTTTTAAVVKFKLPFKAKLVGVTATARASGGTDSPTLTVDVQEAGTTVLSAPVAITAGTVATATVTDTQLADEAVITIDIAITGTNPTFDDIMVLLTVSRN